MRDEPLTRGRADIAEWSCQMDSREFAGAGRATLPADQRLAACHEDSRLRRTCLLGSSGSHLDWWLLSPQGLLLTALGHGLSPLLLLLQLLRDAWQSLVAEVEIFACDMTRRSDVHRQGEDRLPTNRTR